MERSEQIKARSKSGHETGKGSRQKRGEYEGKKILE